MLILRGTARYCVQLQQNSRNTTHRSSRAVRWGRACTCVAAISVSAVIEINVFDYNSVNEAQIAAITFCLNSPF